MNSYIESIYATRQVAGKSGTLHALHSEIDPQEGAFLHRIISEDPSITKTLEVGCAYGLSSLHICDALRLRPEARHTIIDPAQYSYWDGAGIKNLEDPGINFFDLILQGSEFALPELARSREAAFDLVFVDGLHTLDHTLLDCFYATRLLRVGGYLVLDDVTMPAVRKVVDYLLCYPCYEQFAVVGLSSSRRHKLRIGKIILALTPASKRKKIFSSRFRHQALGERDVRMVALRKVCKDERTWDWYKDF